MNRAMKRAVAVTTTAMMKVVTKAHPKAARAKGSRIVGFQQPQRAWGARKTSAPPAALPIAKDGSTWTPEYGDVREDRVVLYGSVGNDLQEFVYGIRATNVGTFAVPPLQGESMYDRSVIARSAGNKIRVVK